MFFFFFLSLWVNKCFLKVNDRHFWNPQVISYAIICNRCRPNSTFFSIVASIVYGCVKSKRRAGLITERGSEFSRWGSSDLARLVRGHDDDRGLARPVVDNCAAGGVDICLMNVMIGVLALRHSRLFAFVVDR